MPKAPSKTRAASARKDPIAKSNEESQADVKEAKSSEPSKARATSKSDPKASHLYTDDNPATTLAGTGFKDAETATNTLSLISRRSLTYQFQTVNTLYHRAKNHPVMKKGPTESNADMRAAIDIFKHWIEEAYPAAKADLRAGGFKPLLSKGCVERFAVRLEDGGGKTFSEVYVQLGRNKRLGNVLMDDSKPGEADWERKRYDALCALVPAGKENSSGWSDDELWVDGKPSKKHLEMIAWAWSPVPERKLPGGMS